MLTRASPRLGKRGLSVLLDNIPPDDPLLVLYPQWFTSALRQRRSIASLRTPAAAKRPSGRYLPDFGHRPTSICSSPRRWVSSTNAEKTREHAENTSSSTAQDDSETGDLKSRSHSPNSGESQEASPPPSSDPPAGRKRAATKSATSRPALRSVKPKGRRQSHLRSLASARLPNDTSLSSVHKFARRDIRKLRRRHFFLRTTGDPDRKSRQSQLSEVKGLLERFHQASHAWSTRGRKREELLVLEETVALLAGVTETAMMENVWYVPMLNGCRIRVLDQEACEGRYRRVVLSGSPKVVELVAEHIARMQQRQADGDPLIEMRSPLVPVYPSATAARRKNQHVPLIRGVWNFYRKSSEAKPLHVVLASWDSVSTVKEFNEFIEDITMSQRSARSRAAGDNYHHHQRVAEALVQLFRAESKTKLFSTAALNSALSYLYTHEFRNHARMVFLKAEHVATVVTFNILLKAAAKWLDIASFRSILMSMWRSGIRPNESTWLAFLDCHVTNRGRTSMATYLEQKGYISGSALGHRFHMTIPDTFLRHLESGRDVDSFINWAVDAGYANEFKLSLLNQMFGVTVRLKDHIAMERLLTICEEQGLELDGVTIMQVLQLYKQNLYKAIPYTLRILGRSGIPIKDYLFDKLFAIAYKKRCYSICRVLWRYACMSGMGTSKMKARIMTSLVERELPASESDIHERFKHDFGKTAVGIGSSKQHLGAVADDLPPEFRTRPLLYLVASPKQDRSDLELRRRVAIELVKADIRAGPLYRSLIPLPLMLHAAFISDTETGVTPRPLNWHLQNTLKVPVVRKHQRLSNSPTFI